MKNYKERQLVPHKFVPESSFAIMETIFFPINEKLAVHINYTSVVL